MAVNVQAAVEAQLLGVNLTGMVAKTTAEVDKKKQTTTEFLIMPSALDENEPITVKKVVDEINRTIYKIEKNTDKIPEGGVPKKVSEKSINDAMKIVGLQNAELTFMQTFIHYKRVVENDGEAGSEAEVENGGEAGSEAEVENGGEAGSEAEVENGGEAGSETEVSKVMEYAIGIHIKGGNPQSTDFKFLQIKEVYINVWDTSNQKVLERMQIWTPEQLEQK